MTRSIALLLLSALSCAAAIMTPTQADLDADLIAAETAWGAHADVASIKWERISDCRANDRDRAGWADLAARTIVINPACRWDAELLQTVVTHEYGHLLCYGVAHSLDKHSAMYYKLLHGQTVTAEDRNILRILGATVAAVEKFIPEPVR